ncbi:aminopeptidase N [Streptomyces sp. NPDC059740]|uniref:aminopeptidase N n=1 Tax=Streptomyces sp. NPDC059740 TaxID=3346926 RepID=UPI0036587B35
MPALQREEAQNRSGLLDVHHYDVHLDLTGGQEHFTSSTTIRFSVRAGAAPTEADAPGTFVELKPVHLHGATIDGAPLDTTTLDDNRLPLPALAAGEHELHVEATMAYSHTGEGLHRFTDPADGEDYVYTQLFLDDVQRVFAAFDQPDLKATFDLGVTAPQGWTVLGNGIATQDPQSPGHWSLATTPPLPTYLVALAAGPWHSVRTEHAGLPFGVHCRRSLAPHLDADEILDLTRRCFDRYHVLFDEPYPFDSYDQAFVPEFNAGAMENPGLVTFREDFVFRSAVTDTERQSRGMVIAHEMAHMWFGDLVTLAWWDDIWLNESFAEYMGYQVLTEASRFTDTWTQFAVSRKGWGYDADQRPSTHPVAPTDVLDTASALLNFDGISYAKGASALRQLVAWIGEKDFLAGINAHFSRHRFGNATLADFLDSLAGATDRDVHAWAAAWLRTTGVDTLTTRTTGGSDGRWHLSLGHTDPTGPARPHRVAVGLYDHDPTTPGRLTARPRLELDVPADPAHPARHDAAGSRPALVLPNDGDLTYAKVRLDEASWRTLRTSLSGLPAPLSRAVAWNTARDMVRDGLLDPREYLETVRAHLPTESDTAVVQGVLAFARNQVADRYLPPADRPAALTTLSETCRAILRHTEGPAHGSRQGLRLAATRTFIDSAAVPDPLADWLSGESVPGGPALDPELRWRILGRLAVLGALTPEDVQAEEERDPSAVGQQGAARCRAALPDPAAKQAAWEALFTDDPDAELSNYLFNATAAGFWNPEQLDLLGEYVPRYFPAALTLAARRGPTLARAAGRQAFPAPFVDAHLLTLGRRLLDDPAPGTEPTPALRRELDDQLDDLARALRVREAWGRGTAV